MQAHQNTYSDEKTLIIKIGGGVSGDRIRDVGNVTGDFNQQNDSYPIDIEDLDPDTLEENRTPLHDIEFPDTLDPYEFDLDGDKISLSQDYETGETFVSRQHKSPESTPTEEFDFLIKDGNIKEKYPELQSEEKLNELKDNFTQSYHNFFVKGLEQREEELNGPEDNPRFPNRKYSLQPLDPSDANSVDCVSSIISQEDDDHIVLGGAIKVTHYNVPVIIYGPQILDQEIEKMFEED